MERSMCGSSLLGSRTTDTRSRTIAIYACGAERGDPYRFSITILFVNAQHTVEALA